MLSFINSYPWGIFNFYFRIDFIYLYLSIYGYKLNKLEIENALKSLGTSVVSATVGYTLGNVLLMIPGIGYIIGSIIKGSVASITVYSIGKLCIKYCEENFEKTEINEASVKYKDLKNKSVEKEIIIKNNQLKYTKSNDNFSIISNYIKPKRCLSVESFNAFYPIKKKYKNHSIKSIDLSNINKNRSSSSTNINTSKDNNIYNNNQLIISTNYISNINKNNNKISKDINNIEITDINNINKNSRNEKIKNKNKNNIISNNNHIREKSHSTYYIDVNNLNKYKFQIKEFNTNNNEINNNINNIIINTSKMIQDSIYNPIKEEESIDFDKILNEFKKNYNIKQLLTKDNLDNKEFQLILPNLYEKYYHFFKYLNNNEILLFSSINKSNGVCALYYWLNYLQN